MNQGDLVMKLKAFALCIVSLLFIACSGDVDVDTGGVEVGPDGVKASDKKETYSYSYSYNGCKTGEHSFSSLADYCRGLADNGKNNFCAEELRCGAFRERCRELELGITCG